MSDINGKWICAPNVDEERWDSSCFYDTKEEAIKNGMEAVKRYNKDPENESLEDELGYYNNGDETQPLDSFAVGKCYSPKISIDADYLLERIAEGVYNECGEFAEGYLDDVKKEDQDELEKLIYDWFVRHKYMPSCFLIRNAEEIDVEGEE